MHFGFEGQDFLVNFEGCDERCCVNCLLVGVVDFFVSENFVLRKFRGCCWELVIRMKVTGGVEVFGARV